jgi:hypothetical protein
VRSPIDGKLMLRGVLAVQNIAFRFICSIIQCVQGYKNTTIPVLWNNLRKVIKAEGIIEMRFNAL